MAPFELEEGYEQSIVNIKVVGVGGAGNNAVNHMIECKVRGVEFIAVNTDKQVLIKTPADTIIPIGEKVTKGQGAGGKPENGAKAAEESADEIAQALKGADMVFITAGMGGGTGTGAAPVIARIAQQMEILTVGVVTKPFLFESRRRMIQAEEGIIELHKNVDALIVIPNERLKVIEQDQKLSLRDAFKKADDVLKHAVQSIAELINVPGYMNLDFADVSSVMKGAGTAHMGVGDGEGKERAELAAKKAISSPLLETSIMGARGVIVSITIPHDAGLDEVSSAMEMIEQEVHEDANLIFGVAFDDILDDEIRITVIATSFDEESVEKEKEPASEPSNARQTPFTASARQSASNAEQTRSNRQDRESTDKKNANEDEEIDDFDNIMDLIAPKNKNKNLFE